MKVLDLETLVKLAPPTIKKEFHTKKITKGSFILYPDEQNDKLFIIVAGEAEVIKQNRDGEMIVLCTYKKSSCFGELEIFNKSYRTMSVMARTNCEIISVHEKTVQQWIESDSRFAMFLMKQLADKLYNLGEISSKMRLLTVRERFLSSIYAHSKLGDLHKVNKTDIIKEITASTRSVNRALLWCKNEQLIFYNKKKFHIMDTEKLERYIEELD